jgi:hypothetical protein
MEMCICSHIDVLASFRFAKNVAISVHVCNTEEIPIETLTYCTCTLTAMPLGTVHVAAVAQFDVVRGIRHGCRDLQKRNHCGSSVFDICLGVFVRFVHETLEVTKNK